MRSASHSTISGRSCLGIKSVSNDAEPPSAMTRARVKTPLRTGVKAIDLFTPICEGQRIGIFAGSGVGKSTLLTMLAKCEGFDTIVVALVGERGREVREFLEGPIHANLHQDRSWWCRPATKAR